ncbi:hypothetical protein J6590_043024 [Homalodisca vitripennis]|nr:hypothetical protein J6590_043024 [Homalodisca vitripennis]
MRIVAEVRDDTSCRKRQFSSVWEAISHSSNYLKAILCTYLLSAVERMKIVTEVRDDTSCRKRQFSSVWEAISHSVNSSLTLTLESNYLKAIICTYLLSAVERMKIVTEVRDDTSCRKRQFSSVWEAISHSVNSSSTLKSNYLKAILCTYLLSAVERMKIVTEVRDDTSCRKRQFSSVWEAISHSVNSSLTPTLKSNYLKAIICTYLLSAVERMKIVTEVRDDTSCRKRQFSSVWEAISHSVNSSLTPTLNAVERMKIVTEVRDDTSCRKRQFSSVWEAISHSVNSSLTPTLKSNYLKAILCTYLLSAVERMKIVTEVRDDTSCRKRQFSSVWEAISHSVNSSLTPTLNAVERMKIVTEVRDDTSCRKRQFSSAWEAISHSVNSSLTPTLKSNYLKAILCTYLLSAVERMKIVTEVRDDTSCRKRQFSSVWEAISHSVNSSLTPTLKSNYLKAIICTYLLSAVERMKIVTEVRDDTSCRKRQFSSVWEAISHSVNSSLTPTLKSNYLKAIICTYLLSAVERMKIVTEVRDDTSCRKRQFSSAWEAISHSIVTEVRDDTSCRKRQFSSVWEAISHSVNSSLTPTLKSNYLKAIICTYLLSAVERMKIVTEVRDDTSCRKPQFSSAWEAISHSVTRVKQPP